VPYPILVLVGPQGSGKKDLALKLVEEFPEYFVYGVSHTTRPMRQGEENGREYHFVTLDDFEVLLKSVSGHIVRNSITYCEHRTCVQLIHGVTNRADSCRQTCVAVTCMASALTLWRLWQRRVWRVLYTWNLRYDLVDL
jgi:hypothetical protein